MLPNTSKNELVIVLFASLIGSILLTWPMIIFAPSTIPGPLSIEPDIHVGIWLPWNMKEQILNLANPMFSPHLYYPEGMDLSLNVWNLGIQTIQIPFFLFFHPVFAYTISIILFGVLNSISGYYLGKTVGGKAAGVAAALVMLSSSFIWNELLSGRSEQGLLAFSAFYLVFLIKIQQSPRLLYGFLAGSSLAVVGLCYWFYAYFLVLITVIYSLSWLIKKDKTKIKMLLVAGIVSFIIVLPFSISLLKGVVADNSVYERATSAENYSFASSIKAHYSIGLKSSLIWPLSEYPHRQQTCIPFVTQFIILFGLLIAIIKRHGLLFSIIAITGIVFGFGPYLLLDPTTPVLTSNGSMIRMPESLLSFLPGFERFWWPNRFNALVVLGAAGSAAIIFKELHKKTIPFLIVLLAIISIFETRSIFGDAPFAAFNGKPEHFAIPTFFIDLASEPNKHPIFQLPFRKDPNDHIIYVPYHKQPISCGLACNQNSLSPVSFINKTKNNPYKALSELNHGIMPKTSIVKELSDIGFHYVVLWKDNNLSVDDVKKALGSEPVFEDSMIAAWRTSF